MIVDGFRPVPNERGVDNCQCRVSVSKKNIFDTLVGCREGQEKAVFLLRSCTMVPREGKNTANLQLQSTILSKLFYFFKTFWLCLLFFPAIFLSQMVLPLYRQPAAALTTVNAAVFVFAQ
ncbi:MAG: hypothetical protein IJ766_06240 [Clostridia bacterium]|nr:hypothetical protein [Clostridia bacterium]